MKAQQGWTVAARLAAVGLAMGLAAGAALAAKVALIVPQTGALAAAGREVEQSTRAWLAAMVKARRLAGLELLVLDDRSTAEGARQAARQAVDQGASMVINCFGSVSCMAIANELQSSAVPLIGAIAGDERLRGVDLPHVFTTRGGAQDEIDIILKYLVGVNLQDLVVVVQDDGFGQSYKRTLDGLLKARPQIRLVATTAVDPQRKNYAEVAALATAKPSLAVVLLANTTHSLGVIEAMNIAGYRGLYFNLAAQANPVFVKRIGELTARNRLVAAFVTMTPHPLRPDPGLDAYRGTLAAHDPALRPSYLGLEAYLNASLAGLLLQAEPTPKGGVPPKDGKLSAEAMGRQLTTLNGTRIGGMSVRFDPVRRQAVHWMDLSVVTSDGRVRSY